VVVEKAVVQPAGLFDLSKLIQLSKGDDAFLEKVITLFIEQALLSLDDLHTALKKNDFGKIKSVAHKLKPSIDNVGIHSLKNTICKIENLALLNQPSPDFLHLINELNDTLKQVISALKSRFTQVKSVV
jgi:HPt (histidine-containing phosphotransfer) domain-containing protein